MSEELKPCPQCDDSGYVETHHGGHWTGEGMRSSYRICTCICGQALADEVAEVESASAAIGDREARDIVRDFVISLTSNGKNRGSTLTINHDELCALVKRSVAILALSQQPPVEKQEETP